MKKVVTVILLYMSILSNQLQGVSGENFSHKVITVAKKTDSFITNHKGKLLTGLLLFATIRTIMFCYRKNREETKDIQRRQKEKSEKVLADFQETLLSEEEKKSRKAVNEYLKATKNKQN